MDARDALSHRTVELDAIMSWAIVAGFRKGENPARWKGNLAALLPKPSKVATKRNFPALSLADARRWWLSLNEREGMALTGLWPFNRMLRCSFRIAAIRSS